MSEAFDVDADGNLVLSAIGPTGHVHLERPGVFD